jgi:hypothetical protein
LYIWGLSIALYVKHNAKQSTHLHNRDLVHLCLLYAYSFQVEH